MRLRTFFATFLVFSLAAMAADDPVIGRWVLDEAAFRDLVERHYAEALLQIPAEQQAAAQAIADEAVDAAVEQMAGSAAVFEADGDVTLIPAKGAPQEGSWSRQGDEVVLQPDNHASEAVTLIGTVEDGQLRLRPDIQDSIGFLMRRAES